MDYVFAVLEYYPSPATSGKAAKQNDVSIRNYMATLAKLSPEGKRTILANAADVLETLDPSVNSIGCLAVLDMLIAAIATTPSINRRVVLDKVVDFLVKFDPYQIRYVGESMLKLLGQVASGGLFPHLIAVELLATAILRIDPSGSMFTTTHLAMAKLGYESKNTESTLKVIDCDIAFFPNMTGPKEPKLLCDKNLAPAAYISGLTEAIKPTTVLEYNLIRGLIYTSRRDWSKAQAAFEQVITHPAKDKAVSKIMSETHKKWVLVGLLSNGKAPTLPSYASSTAKHSYGMTSKPYTLVASAFNTNQAARLRAEFEENRSTWEEDGNTSLINEVMGAYQKWQIINLRRIYSEVSIAQVQSMTLSAETGKTLEDPGEVLTLIEGMISSDMFKGVLQPGASAEESYLAFHGDSASMAESEFTKELVRSHKNVELLSKQYHMTNERLSHCKDYVRFMAREQKLSEKEGADPEDGFDSQIEDEDLMTGIVPHT